MIDFDPHGFTPPPVFIHIATRRWFTRAPSRGNACGRRWGSYPNRARSRSSQGAAPPAPLCGHRRSTGFSNSAACSDKPTAAPGEPNLHRRRCSGGRSPGHLELEPGAHAFEKMELPEPKRFQPANLEAFLDAVRWGAASIADTRQLQSPSAAESRSRAIN